MNKADVITIGVAILTLLAQALWVFQDARKRGQNHWMWGLFGLLSVPTSLIIYLIVSRVNKTTCPDCHREIKKDYIVCPYCRNELQK